MTVARSVAPGGLLLIRGIQYNPLQHTARWCRDTGVNYIAVFELAER